MSLFQKLKLHWSKNKSIYNTFVVKSLDGLSRIQLTDKYTSHKPCLILQLCSTTSVDYNAHHHQEQYAISINQLAE